MLRLIETLIQSTTPPGAQSSDPFWTKSETALLQALVLYLMHEAPKDEQNLAMVMEMLAAAEVREEDEEYESPLEMCIRDRRWTTLMKRGIFTISPARSWAGAGCWWYAARRSATPCPQKSG